MDSLEYTVTSNGVWDIHGTLISVALTYLSIRATYGPKMVLSCFKIMDAFQLY